jgi:hypothetical protein
MYRIVWEFEVKPERAPEFVDIYGPAGKWATFFRKSPDYAGTELFRGTTNALHFVTLDSWRSRVAYEQFRKANADDYAALDDWCEQLIDRERTLGVTDDGRD